MDIRGINEDQPLRIEIEDYRLIISIGIERLDGHATHPKIPELPVDDWNAFASDVALALWRETGSDGSTLLMECIDKAIERAIDDGADGFDYSEFEGWNDHS